MLNVAAVPVPFALPLDPLPANVVTSCEYAFLGNNRLVQKKKREVIINDFDIFFLYSFTQCYIFYYIIKIF